MSLFNKKESVGISFTFDQELLDLYGIKNKDRMIDTLTMIFRDCNNNINVNLAFVKEMMDEQTISKDEACILVHQISNIYSELNHLQDVINIYCEN